MQEAFNEHRKRNDKEAINFDAVYKAELLKGEKYGITFDEIL